MLKIWQPVSLKDYADYGNLNTLDNKKECIIVTFKKTSKCLIVYDEERDRDQLTKSCGALFCRLQKTGNVALTENCQRGIQQIAAHAHRSFGKWNLHISHGICYVAREFHYLNRSVYSTNRWASHKMCQQLQSVPRAEIANCFQLWTLCRQIESWRHLCAKIFRSCCMQQYSGATGSGPMQINNDQLRVDNRESRLENRQPVAMWKSISRLAKHIFEWKSRGNHVFLMHWGWLNLNCKRESEWKWKWE